MSKNGNKWEISPKQRLAITYFLSACGISEVANELNLNCKTDSNRLSQTVFRDKLNIAFQKYRDQVIIQLASQQKKALSLLESVIEDEKASYSEKSELPICY